MSYKQQALGSSPSSPTNYEIQTYFCDLGGTLFGKNLTVSAENVVTINRLNNNIGFSICTARGASETLPLVSKIKLSAPQILENGATVVSPEGKVLRQCFLPQTIAKEIIGFISSYSIWKKVCIDGQMLDFNDNLNYAKLTKIALQDLTEEMHSEISKELSKYKNIYYSKSHAAHKPGYLTMDISNIESTKQEAILYVRKLLNLKKEEIVGIGDSYNDFPLLIACGLKIAMGNAVSEIKEIADYIAPSVDESGVAVALKKYFP